jgi:hypothetical protein
MSTTTTLPYFRTPTVEVTERSDGHLLPFMVAVAIFLVSVAASLAIVGLPA